VVSVKFLHDTPNGLKQKGLFSKYGRGLMARWVIQNDITSPNELANFNLENHLFSKELSSQNEYVFIAPRDFTLLGRFKKK
jgi:cytoplasmic iron level regulating protein YaaA (DUF328/UPF0246 family)